MKDEIFAILLLTRNLRSTTTELIKGKQSTRTQRNIIECFSPSSYSEPNFSMFRARLLKNLRTETLFKELRLSRNRNDPRNEADNERYH